MSVTFTASMAPIIGYRLTDVAGGRSAEVYASYDDAGRALVALRESGGTLPGCTDPEFVAMCGHHIEPLTTDMGEGDELEVNLSNTNARTMLDTLGIVGEELFGSMDATQFLGRVLTALAVAPQDCGVPAMADTCRPNITHCGRPEGYIQYRLAQLHDLAQWCVVRGRAVQWA